MSYSHCFKELRYVFTWFSGDLHRFALTEEVSVVVDLHHDLVLCAGLQACDVFLQYGRSVVTHHHVVPATPVFSAELHMVLFDTLAVQHLGFLQ